MVDNPEPAPPSRRDAILAAAEREFATAGFAGARIERIAAAAQVNKQLLFHYFTSKQGLFAAAVASLVVRLDSDSPTGTTPVEEVRALLGSMLRAVRAWPGIVALLADAGRNPEFPGEASTPLWRWRERVVSRLRQALVDGQRRGYFRDDLDPDAVAVVAAAAVFGLATLPRYVRSRAGSRGAEAEADAILTRFVADYCAWR